MDNCIARWFGYKRSMLLQFAWSELGCVVISEHCNFLNCMLRDIHWCIDVNTQRLTWSGRFCGQSVVVLFGDSRVVVPSTLLVYKWCGPYFIRTCWLSRFCWFIQFMIIIIHPWRSSMFLCSLFVHPRRCGIVQLRKFFLITFW